MKQCSECGRFIPDDAIFCSACGMRQEDSGQNSHCESDKTVHQDGDLESPEPAPDDLLGATKLSQSEIDMLDAATRISSMPDDPAMPEKKEVRRTHKPMNPWIAPMIAMVLAVVVVIVSPGKTSTAKPNHTGNPITNYTGYVLSWAPYVESQGITSTVEEVFSRYIPDGDWRTLSDNSSSGVVLFVGKLNGADGQCAVVFNVTPDEHDGDQATIEVSSFKYDGDELNAADPAQPLSDMFEAYNMGMDTLNVNGLASPMPEITEEPVEPVELVEPTDEPAIVPDTPDQAIDAVPTAYEQMTTGFDVNGFVFADSSERYLSPAELAGLSLEMLGYARNEIFARNGNLFRKDKYINHYTMYDWYNEMPYKRHDVNLEDLNPIEQANVRLILQREAELGG